MRIDVSIALCGAAAGLGSAILFRWISARVPRVALWLPAAQLARALVTVDDDVDFLARYGDLVKLLVRYLARQALTLVLPCLVAATVAMLVVPSVQGAQDDPSALGSDRERPPLLSLHASPRSLPSSFAGEGLLHLDSDESEVVFVAFLCVGSALGMVRLPRKS